MAAARGHRPSRRAKPPPKHRNPYRRPDRFTLAAREAGLPARSVFKLQEIDRRWGILRRGQRVLDLGAAPGSWSMYAAERIRPGGQLVAVDLRPLRQAPEPGGVFIQADVQHLDRARLRAAGPFDVVLSDMAPLTSGDRATDQWRSFELFCCAVEVAAALVVPGGCFVGKLFMSGSFPEARDRLRACFETVRAIRPEATRASSFEIFLVGLKAKGPQP